jgi:hypothetical protein
MLEHTVLVHTEVPLPLAAISLAVKMLPLFGFRLKGPPRLFGAIQETINGRIKTFISMIVRTKGPTDCMASRCDLFACRQI